MTWHARVIRNATVTMRECRTTPSQKWLGGHKALMVYARWQTKSHHHDDTMFTFHASMGKLPWTGVFNHTTNNTKLLALPWLTHDPADDEKKNRAENILIAFQRTALYGICVQRPSKLVIMKRLELLKHVTESNRAWAIVLRAYLSDIETQSTHRDQTALVISPSNPFSMHIRNLICIEKGFEKSVLWTTPTSLRSAVFLFFYQDNPKSIL